MNRNTVTTINNLQVGDRFYVANDRKKEVWEKVDQEKKVTNFQTYRNFGRKQGMKFPHPFKSNTQVVFLRHSMEEELIS